MHSRLRRRILAVCFVLLPLSVAAQPRPDALAAYNQGRFRDAIDITTAELAVDAINMNAYTVQGWAHLALEEYQQALNTATRGMRVVRYDPRVIWIAGEALYRLGTYDRALAYFREYVTLEPRGARIAETYAAVGEILSSYGEYHTADIAFATSLYHRPRHPQTLLRWAETLERVGETEAAVAAYRSLLAEAPTNAAAIQALERLAPPD